jgi:hypothetical protein
MVFVRVSEIKNSRVVRRLLAFLVSLLLFCCLFLLFYCCFLCCYRCCCSWCCCCLPCFAIGLLVWLVTGCFECTLLYVSYRIGFNVCRIWMENKPEGQDDRTGLEDLLVSYQMIGTQYALTKRSIRPIREK